MWNNPQYVFFFSLLIQHLAQSAFSVSFSQRHSLDCCLCLGFLLIFSSFLRFSSACPLQLQKSSENGQERPPFPPPASASTFQADIFSFGVNYVPWSHLPAWVNLLLISTTQNLIGTLKGRELLWFPLVHMEICADFVLRLLLRHHYSKLYRKVFEMCQSAKQLSGMGKNVLHPCL